MKTKKRIIIGAIVGVAAAAIAAVSLCFGLGLFHSFDAEGYVCAILNQNFKGNVKEAAAIVEGKTEKELLKQYEDGIVAFVQNNITSGIEMDEELEEKYVSLCKDIFASMKYRVQEAEKKDGDKYEVAVEYQTTDVFSKFMTSVAEESARLMEKVEKGEYQGTLEEINLQMQQEFLNNSYELLQTAQKDAQYGEKEVMTFIVEKDEKGLYTMKEEQIYEFVLKIMGLDEIQD